MFNIKEFLNGIRLKAKAVLASDTKGELEVDDTSGKLNYHNGTTRSPVVTESHTSTLTNKTFDANGTGNSLSNVETADLASGVLNTSTTLAAASDTQVPSALAVKTYVDNVADAQDEASEIAYSNATSGLAATNVQTAIDEVEGRVDTAETNIGNNATAISDHISDATDAHDASAISNVPAGNLAATDVQAALNELQGDADTNATNLSNHLSDATDAHDASAISSVPAGNLAATDVQTALDELQSDIDTRALDSDLTTHTSDTATHGATGAVVGTTNTQTLTNKTLTTPTIEDAAVFEQITTPANPASGFNKVYPKADGKFYTLNSDGDEVALGSGAGSLDVWHTEDFSTTIASDATAGKNATFLGAGAATASPDNETTSPIAGTRSIKYTQVASSLNDYGAFPAVATELKQRNNYSGVTFYSTYSGNDSDVSFIVYDVTNTSILYDMPIKAGSGRQRHEFAFLVPSTCTSIRYGYQVKVENIGAVLVIDDVEISTNPFVYKELSNDTDWEEYTDAVNQLLGFGTPTNVFIETRQDGSDLLVRGRFTTGTVPVSGVQPTLKLPPGLLIRTDLLSGTFHTRFGEYNRIYSLALTDGFATGAITNFSTDDSRLHFAARAADSTQYQADWSGTIFGSTELVVLGEIRVPIQGWTATSENVVSPMDNVAPVRYQTSAGQSIPTGTDTIVNFGTELYDNDGLVTTGASWVYTAKETGVYSVKSMVAFVATATEYQAQLRLHKNGSLDTVLGFATEKTVDTSNAKLYVHGGTELKLNKGDTLNVLVFQSTGSDLALSATGTENHITVSRVDKNPIGLFPFQSATLDATGSGNFTGGSLKLSRINNTVTITSLTNLTYPSSSSPQSALGFIPTEFRPSVARSSLFYCDGNRLWLVYIDTDGLFLVEARDWSGTLSATTTAPTLTTITYNL